MSDEEYEKFEINDYDLDNEFNMRRRRPTKNQQIYGIWADDSDNEGAGTSSFGGGRGRRGGGGKAAKDYTAPVSFVAGGVQQSGKKKDEHETKGSGSDDEEDDASRPAFGRTGTSSESDGEAETVINTPMAGFRRSAGPAQKYPGNIANWEKHTTGIGSKLLLKMGYEPGRGLGKNLQGISTPIEAHVRKGRGAIGAYGTESGLTLADQKAPKKVDEDEKESKEFKEKLQQWKKHGPEKGKKFRYFYKTPEDVIQEKGNKKGQPAVDKFTGSSSKLSQVTVIDMTGPEKRVLSGYHALGQTKAATDEVIYDRKQAPKQTVNFHLPELMHNLNLIVDLCEQEIIANDKLQKSVQDREVVLKRDKDNLEKVIELEANHIHKLEETVELVEQLVNPKGELTLERAEHTFLVLQTEFESEYEDFALSDLVPGVIAPLVNTKLRDWNPLAEPTKHIDILKRWRDILRTKDIQSATLFEPYSALVWSGIIPSIRMATHSWNPKEYQVMIALLDAWAPLFPSRIFDNILEQMILPKLTVAVEKWDPLTDHVAIHIWIQPWSGLLVDKLDERVYPMIREKLGNALRGWVPQDRSALAMLKPWKNVFKEADFKVFLQRHVVPKIQVVLSEMIINPLQQDLEFWNQFWEWHELIVPQMVAQLLDKFFFPRWMQTLVIWLNQNPNLDQVARWYSGWKSLLSDEVQREVVVKEHLRRALEIMHRATGNVIPVEMQMPQVVSTPPPPPIIHLDGPTVPPVPTIEFKELVGQKCADLGVIFIPMPGRREQGKQVYRIGAMFCYIDRSVIMMSDGTLQSWAPVSLAVALEKAVSG